MFQRRVEGYTMEIALHKVLHKCLISTAMSPVMDIQFRNGRFIRSKVRGFDQIGLFDGPDLTELAHDFQRAIDLGGKSGKVKGNDY